MSKDTELSDKRLAELGWELVRLTFVLLKIARLHGANNEAWAPALEKVRGVVREAEEVTLRSGDNVLYMGDVRIKVDRDGFAAQMGVVEAFASHGVGSLHLEPGYDDGALKALLTSWGGSSPASPEEGFALLEGLVAGNEHIRLEKSVHATPDVRNDREMAKAIYARTLNAVGDVMESVRIKQTLPLKRAKRVMQRLVDQLLADPVNLLGLTNLRCYDEYTYHHSVNVCVLSLSIGRRMGLPKPMLAQLGMSSLFHDVGKSRVPIEVLNKPGEFDDAEWDMIRKHPVYGVTTLVKLKGADELAARVVTGSFEHHMGYDGSGYPRLAQPRAQSLYGRVISLADCYDAMTSARVYNRTPLTPERALKFMLGKSGQAFDPVLIKIFVNTIGIFPVGTLLLLDTGEVGVVFKTHDDPVLGDRPYLRVITDRNGKELPSPVELSLDEKTPGGTYVRNIVRILDPAAFGVDVARYFL